MSLRYAILAFTVLAVPCAAQSPITEIAAPGEVAFPFFGFRLSAADLDGDGSDEVLVAAVEDSEPSGPEYAGRVYTFSDGDSEPLFTLASPNEQEAGFFGQAATFIGDITGDGVPDIAVTAEGEPTDPNRPLGFVYLFSGADNALLGRLKSPFVTPTPLGFGTELLGIPDVDGDGTPDIAVSSREEGRGRVYLFSGQTQAQIRVYECPGNKASTFGISMALTDDLDGDGIEDLVVGAANGIPNMPLPPPVQSAYVFSTVSGDLLLEVQSPAEDSLGDFAAALATVGDLNGDGVRDLAVGAGTEQDPTTGEDTGVVYVFSAADGALIHTLSPPFAFNNPPEALRILGVPDVDGDGVEDIVVAWYARNWVVVFSGATGLPLRTLDTPTESPAAAFGRALGLARQGGEPRLLVGAPSGAPSGETGNRGAVFAYSLATLVPVGAENAAGDRALSLNVSPNPTVGALWARVGLDGAQAVTLDVLDVLGRRVLRRDVQLAAGVSPIDLDLTGQAPGVYVVRVVADDAVRTVPVTVAR